MLPKCPLKEDDSAVTYKYEVTLEEAREGLLKALVFLEAASSIPFCHVQMLSMVLHYFEECVANHKQDDKRCFSQLWDSNAELSSPQEKQPSRLLDSRSDLNGLNQDDNCCKDGKEEDKKNEIVSDINGSTDVNQVTTDGISDNYQNESTSEGVQQLYENSRMGLVGKCASHLSWLAETVPDSLAIGKSTLMHKQLGVFTTKPVSCGFKWGPYKLVDVQAALFRRNNIDNNHNEDIPWLPVYLLACLSNSKGQTNSNVKISMHGEQMFIVTTKNIASGTELHVALMDPEDEQAPVMHRNTPYWNALGCPMNEQSTPGSVSLSLTSLQSQTGEQPVDCKTIGESRESNHHIVIHSNKTSCKCFVCGQRFTQALKLKKHMRHHHDMDSSVCDFNTITKLLPEGLTVMRSTVHGEKWGIFTKSKVEAGIRWGPSVVSNNLSKFIDKSCTDDYHDDTRFLWLHYIQFTNNEHLLNIRMQKEGTGVYYISTKDIPPHTELLVGILESQQPSEIKPRLKHARCGNCNKWFSDASELSIHRLQYCAERPYKCSICHRSFINSECLTNHKAVHNRQRLHMCTVCGKGFRMSKDLKRHHLIHTGERPYRCTVCGKAFTQQGSIKRHMVVHTGERQYMCDVCGKDFTDLSHFRRHQKIHFGSKCHVCNICGKAFLYADKLRTHIRIHTGEKPYHCAICGKDFASDSSFSKHRKTHADIPHH